MATTPRLLLSTTRTFLSITMLFLLTAHLLAQSTQKGASSRRPAGPKPLDPLTAEEKRTVERTARADSRVQELLSGGRQRLISVEFLAVKPEDPGRAQETAEHPISIGRHGVALFYLYEGNYGVRAVVDLEKASVLQVARVDGDSVPLAAEEVSEAGKLALRDSSVRRLLGSEAERYTIEGLRSRGTGEGDPCAAGRCTELIFRRGSMYLAGARVIVNLTSQTVRIAGGEK
jgi:hypothetical protein